MKRKLSSAFQGRFLQALAVFALACLAPACGDDTVPAQRDQTLSNLPAVGDIDAGKAQATASQPARTNAPSTGVSAESSESILPLAPDAGQVDAGSESVACVPVRCECPDRNAADCCPEAIPYRSETVSAELAVLPEEVVEVVTTYSKKRKDLWSDFSQSCGVNSGCHVGKGSATAVGIFQLTEDTFGDRPQLGDDALGRIHTDDVARVMPPGSADGKRACGHPIAKLGRELLAFQNSGFAERFEVDLCPEDIKPTETKPSHSSPKRCGETPSNYLLPEVSAFSMTNLGSCIPAAEHEVCPETVLRAKDELFSKTKDSEGLPDSLRETDIVSLDSEVLAANRVYGYSPTYTLFSDNAKKQRYVRVPLGKKIRYNAKTQDFDIPDNTRFYKTFLRQVTDSDGNIAFRKMETRLIVVRNDQELDGGKFGIRALRATYAWSKDEHDAIRVKDPLNNGQEWADRMCPVVVNATATRNPATNPLIGENGVGHENDACQYMTPDELENAESGEVRHYAIPGATRCDQCHMGSHNHSYILGFNPWQVDHRKEGEGGTYDPVHPDELTQLKRFLEYGVVEGIAPGEAKLEDSQGDRKPRNDYELKAQAYMLGNCVNCHSGHGFPTVENPVLGTFNLYPNPNAEGGIFRFPLDKASPRIRLGADQRGRMAYISAQIGWNGAPRGSSMYFADEGEVSSPDTFDEPIIGEDQFGNPVRLGVMNTPEDVAPWNSAIWRNVYTPFTYFDETYGRAIFIHMPRNVPGFDCRAHKIMAQWMLSIPSRALESNGTDAIGNTEEVKESDEAYPLEVALGQARVKRYLGSLMGQHCPDDVDILDPKVLTSLRVSGDPDGRLESPAPRDYGDLNGPRVLKEATQFLTDGVPDHDHWITADFTPRAGQWQPRRADWHSVLADESQMSTQSSVAQSQVSEAMRPVIEEVRKISLGPDLEKLALEPVPMGFWSKRCSETAAHRSDSLTRGQLLNQPITSANRWATYGPWGGVLPEASRQIHSISRGQAVFEAICQNCHGANYDSKSPLASTVAELTGGGSRVADFRNGLFGPVNAPGAYAESVFTFSKGNNGGTPADWQARYMLFMGLGGTLATIPTSVLGLIAVTPVYGQAVSSGSISATANMLVPATAKCENLWETTQAIDWNLQRGTYALSWNSENAPRFAKESGHLQLWEALCGFGQAPMIRVASRVGEANGTIQLLAQGVYYSRDRAGNDVYPSDTLVGDPAGTVTRGIQPGNYAPWCVDRRQDEVVQWLVRTKGLNESQIPYCPSQLFATAFGGKPIYLAGATAPEALEDKEQRARWLRRGGMNAGLAVYYYLDRVSKGVISPVPNFDSQECAP